MTDVDSEGGISGRLARLGLTLPAPTPTAFSYRPALRYGNVVHVAGQIPKVSVDRLSVTGILGQDVEEQDAAEATRLCILHALTWVAHCAGGSLDAVDQVLRVNYFFQVPEAGFGRMSQVADAGSNLLADLFGAKGRHARSVIGVRELPRFSPVLVDMEVALRG